MNPLVVLLNHFYLTLDAPTYGVIAESAFLRTQFAPNEIRTTHRTDRSYTGLYFYGEKTYFEFFDVTTETNRHIGDSAIAFGLEQKGATGSLLELWPDATRLTITRPSENNQVNWFEMLIPSGFSLESPIAVWSMEYMPSFLQEWKKTLGRSWESEGTIARAAVLERYSSLIPSIEKPILKNIIGITVWVDSLIYEAFVQFSHDFGYSMTDTENGFSFTDADGVKYRISLSDGDLHGITEVEFDVNDVPGQRKWSFGNSTLTFNEEKTAVWQFRR
ncbi:DUF5829 family protein [Runella slithyformis]|uniref:Uncharacterized protein n=1 Tax=Runella slithyformis (strain ATCC 29530 / DSM 19594 / LMG 11500 / NCIMB 11436 / LSU 4) TaxID=761193 RepID=A0A7U3ZP87_RUNSL|nr:DUF5829 family protein [Runella slithyformis]AEI50836.1 hypothetical protein Runsl_4514 [Runella slithyformis DSM 19594]